MDRAIGSRSSKVATKEWVVPVIWKLDRIGRSLQNWVILATESHVNP